MADGPAGTLPLSQSGLELSRPGIMITAFGPNPDGDGLVLRLWEQAGQSGSVTAKLSPGLRVKTMQPVDLRGQPAGRPIPVKRETFTTPLDAFAPASFTLVASP